MLTETKPPTTESAAAQFLADVRSKNQDFYATARGNGALKDLQQTFPHPWLYVGELLQNAVDAEAKALLGNNRFSARMNLVVPFAVERVA